MSHKVAHIAVTKLADSITEIYDHAPNEIVLDSVIESLIEQDGQAQHIRQNMLEEDEADIVAPALEAWDEERGAFRARLDEYVAAFEGAESADDVQAYVLDPIFDAEYAKDMNIDSPPGWRDLETPTRLLNDLAQIMSVARPKDKKVQNELAEDFKSTIRNSFEKIEAALTEPMMGGGQEGDQSTLDWAKEKAQEAISSIDDYIKLKKIHDTAKRNAPLIFGALGAAAIILLANRR